MSRKIKEIFMGLFGKKHSIGKTIAELRKAKGWTQIELAEKLQVSDKAISKWEKDSGVPSIEFFPALAELFDVSIDYLMTGKEDEPEIITISKAELCAKNDDISMLKDINLNTKDENSKTLIDYIIQYKSCKVFAEICEKIDSKKFGVERYIEYSLITNRTNAIEGIKENYVHIEDKSYFEKKEGVKPLCIITDKLLDIVVLDKRVNRDTIDYLLSNQKGRNCVWYLVLPYLLHQSYLHKNIKLFDKILEVSIASNQYAYDKMPITYDSYYGYNYELRYFMIASKNGYGNKVHGLVRALEKTIKLALERSDIETVEKLNNLNNAVMKYYEQFKCYIADSDEIRIAKLKLDKTVSKDEIKIQSTIHNGIINIDELLSFNNFKLIKNALEKYPIHIIETLYSFFVEEKSKALFEFSVDHKDNTLARIIIEKDKEELEPHLLKYWKENVNKNHLYLLVKGEERSLLSNTYGRNYWYDFYKNEGKKSPKTLCNLIDKLKECKQRIIDELALKLDKEKLIKELTKEYFESELKKGNTDIVVIRLCVRLETILRCDYHYEGDFAEMLKKYCNEHLSWYDDEGYPDGDDKTTKILNNLRVKRNSIVHSEKSNVELSLDDIQYCIDYICKLG